MSQSLFEENYEYLAELQVELNLFAHDCIHHNWSLQPFGKDYGLRSQNTYVVCINFLHKQWRP